MITIKWWVALLCAIVGYIIWDIIKWFISLFTGPDEESGTRYVIVYHPSDSEGKDDSGSSE